MVSMISALQTEQELGSFEKLKDFFSFELLFNLSCYLHSNMCLTKPKHTLKKACKRPNSC